MTKGRAFQPRIEHRDYLYQCTHCGWLNVVMGEHARTGIRKGYTVQMMRQNQSMAWDAPHDRGYVATRPGDRVQLPHGALFTHGQPHLARCGRPLLFAPEPSDLCWPDDNRKVNSANFGYRDTVDVYCKNAFFNNPQLMKHDVVQAADAAALVGGPDALLALITTTRQHLVINTGGKYAGRVPVVLPLWLPDGRYPDKTDLTYGLGGRAG